jgi:hypothetical protein
MAYPPPPAPQQRGCLRTLFILFAIFVVLAVGGITWSYYSFVRTAKKYTSEQAAPIPVEKATQEQYEQILRRIGMFTSRPEGSKAMLQLSAGDLNALLAMAPDWNEARGRCYIKIKDGHVIVMGSFDVVTMAGIPMPGLRGRYVNGALHCVPNIREGVLHVVIDHITANAEPLPEKLQRNVAPGLENGMAGKLAEDKILGPVIAGSGSVKVEGDSLTFVSK